MMAVAGLSCHRSAGDGPDGSYNDLALTPPMGFNDWNAYKCNVSAALIEQTARRTWSAAA